MRNPILKAKKAVTLLSFKQKRDDEIFAPINGIQVDTDRSLNDLKGSVEMWDVLGNPASITWTLADNTEQDFTKAELQAVIETYAVRKLTTFSKYQTLKQEVENAINEDQLDSVSW